MPLRVACGRILSSTGDSPLICQRTWHAHHLVEILESSQLAFSALLSTRFRDDNMTANILSNSVAPGAAEYGGGM